MGASPTLLGDAHVGAFGGGLLGDAELLARLGALPRLGALRGRVDRQVAVHARGSGAGRLFRSAGEGRMHRALSRQR